MKSVTLFQAGSHITDVSIQYNGEIAIGSGGSGGEYYLRVKPEAKASLLGALIKEMRVEPDKLTDTDTQILMLLNMGFSDYKEDPYDEIKELLKKHDIQFKSEYWPSR